MNHPNQNPGHDLVYWLVAIILLFIPATTIFGIIMVVRKLIRSSGRRQRRDYQTQPPPYQATTGAAHAAQPPRKQPRAFRGKGLAVWGGVLAATFGIALACGLPIALLGEGLIALAYFSPVYGFFILGLLMIYLGVKRNKREKRIRKYLALIGRRDSIPIRTLADAMPVAFQAACDDLQAMLDEGYLSVGYLDFINEKLILNNEGIPDQPKEEKKAGGMNEDDAILNEIRLINNLIDDAQMSQKIDRIGEISSKIFAYQRQNPAKSGQLRSFLNYYLPTTLKILRAYAQLEAQGVDGENISAAKRRIEQMMDKIVDGFEKQLDRLFQGDMMDLTADVAVLEQMLKRDGLSDDMTMGFGR